MKRTICVGVSRTFTGAETKKALSCLAGYPGWKSRALRYDSHSENFFMPYMAGFSYWDIKKFVAILDPGGWFYNMRANGEKMEKVCLDVIERLVDGSQGIVFDCTLVDLMAAKKRGFLTRNYLSIGYSVDQKWRVSWHGDFVGDSVLLRGEDFLRRLFDVVGIKFEEGELRVEERPIEGGPSYFAIRGKYSKMCVNRKITDVANPQEEKVICVGAFQEERLREFRSLENGEVAGEYIQVSGLSLARASRLLKNRTDPASLEFEHVQAPRHLRRLPAPVLG